MSIPLGTDALGISPPRIDVSAILRDTVQTKAFIISKSPEESGDIHVSVDTRGPHASAVVLPVASFTIPAGQDQYRYEFQIAPKLLANGEYDVPVRFLKDEPKAITVEGAASSAVRTGVEANVFFTIGGEEVVRYSLANFQVLNSEVGQQLAARLTIANTGNVTWVPSRMLFKFVDLHDAQNIVAASADPEDLPASLPGSTTEVTVPVRAELIEGEYEVQLFLSTDGSQQEPDAVFKPLSIYKTGTLAQKGELLSLTTNKASYSIGEKVKIVGEAHNTGMAPIMATLYTELSRGETVLDTLRSEDVLVVPGATELLTVYTTAEQKGEYTIDAHMRYGIQKTNKKEVTYAVIGSIAVLEGANSWAGISALVLFLVMGAWFIKRRRERSTVPIDTTTVVTSINPTMNTALDAQGPTIVLGAKPPAAPTGLSTAGRVPIEGERKK
jgi:hypothetical protein